MTLRDPNAYADKTADWLQFFTSQRRLELADLATESVLQEHANDPRGTLADHSDELQQLLNFARGLPIAAKVFVHAVRPHETYRLARMAGRGGVTEYFDDREYGTEREAVHAAFVARLTEQGVLASSETAGSEVAR
ncbi:MAG: N,N-dimethylformamidase small subunit [Nocardioidaceae bacterium]|jgi:hypothetical protein|nr:N,N-dimethylformamidase small subunit [Nocardioidaceae bacterium]